MTRWAPTVKEPVECIQAPILSLNEQVMNAIDIPTLILWVIVGTICMSLWIWLYTHIDVEEEQTVEATIVKDKIKLSHWSWDMLQK